MLISIIKSLFLIHLIYFRDNIINSLYDYYLLTVFI